MKVFFDNWNPNSSSGPNGFGKKLYSTLKDQKGIDPFWVGNYSEKPDIQLSFIQSQVASGAPIVQRLDGIYFNSDQDYEAFNRQIQETYKASKAVVFQSNFNKLLIENWFGKHDNSVVIRNGTCLEEISKIPILENDLLSKYDNIWCCASSWRPHKRLSENIKYFMEFSGPNDCLIIAGENPDVSIANPKVFYAGHLDRPSLISLFKLSDYFIHLAWLDHCPNVVVDARASGCHIICSSSGGTKEVAGLNSTIIAEEEWDFKPVKLYEPPIMDFSMSLEGTMESDLDINNCSKRYIELFKGVL